MKLSRYEQKTIVNYDAGEQTVLSGRTRYQRSIPFPNPMSATANRGQSAQSRGKQAKRCSIASADED